MCFELLSNLPPFASKQLFETCSGLEYRHSKIEMSLFFTNKHVEDIILETEVCLGQGTLLAFFFLCSFSQNPLFLFIHLASL